MLQTPLPPIAVRLLCSLSFAVALGLPAAASAPRLSTAPQGAILTALPSGARTGYDIYAFKSDVYLSGGPGDGAPFGSVGLPEGRYVFQVTDPTGRVLLSLDQAKCREFDVSGGGVIARAVAAGGCEHATGIGRGAGALSIQLCGGGLAAPDAPTGCFSDTPLPGGEYKVWVTSEADYLTGCAQLGKPDGLAEIDCGAKTKSYFHGFMPQRSRTTNFKVGGQPRSIVTRFYGLAGSPVDGMQVTWSDPLGGSNNVHTHEDLSIDLHHEARIDNIELGSHEITVKDQPGCVIGTVYIDGKRQPKTGSQTISIMAQTNLSDWFGTVFVDIYCR